MLAAFSTRTTVTWQLAIEVLPHSIFDRLLLSLDPPKNVSNWAVDRG